MEAAVRQRGQHRWHLNDRSHEAGIDGKRVGVAAAGSGTQVSVRMILKHFGIKADEKELGLAQSTQRLADGQLDAFFYAGGTPFAALIQLGSTKGFELYKFGLYLGPTDIVNEISSSASAKEVASYVAKRKFENANVWLRLSDEKLNSQ